MADDLLIQTCDAIKTAIQSHDWSREFALARGYADLDAKLEENDRLRVDVVVPEAWDDHELVTQGDEVYTVAVEVAVRKLFGMPEQDATTGEIRPEKVDELITFVGELSRYFTADRFADLADVAWIGTQVPQLYSRAMLAEFRQFTSVIELSFQITIQRS